MASKTQQLVVLGNVPNIFKILQIKDLKRGIKVKMSRKEVLEKTGELISLRYAITRISFI